MIKGSQLITVVSHKKTSQIVSSELRLRGIKPPQLPTPATNCVLPSHYDKHSDLRSRLATGNYNMTYAENVAATLSGLAFSLHPSSIYRLSVPASG